MGDKQKTYGNHRGIRVTVRVETGGWEWLPGFKRWDKNCRNRWLACWLYWEGPCLVSVWYIAQCLPLNSTSQSRGSVTEGGLAVLWVKFKPSVGCASRLWEPRVRKGGRRGWRDESGADTGWWPAGEELRLGDCHLRSADSTITSAATLSLRRKPRQRCRHTSRVYRSGRLIFRCQDSVTF